mmetsp:Transcript_3797/g.3540  ORF Transcript_3797/g.3540 Transcript_3797/m.3540 type:complete len:111 (-) Transcript_3797:8-340(-)
MLIIGVLLMISVPTGLHALYIPADIPTAYCLFIYIEVAITALHVIQTLKKIMMAVFNSSKFNSEINLLPSERPKDIIEETKTKEKIKDDPYARVRTAIYKDTSRAPRRKQ